MTGYKIAKVTELNGIPGRSGEKQFISFGAELLGPPGKPG